MRLRRGTSPQPHFIESNHERFFCSLLRYSYTPPAPDNASHGRTILVLTHDRELIESCCDNVVEVEKRSP
ncbi:hypothetical protein DXB50_11015 [Butyricicoccus sp. OM04-18BH]|nr:hypothetical protein DW923_00380 [Butyricicoccus sp. AM42-5AC]RHV39756.1 hypothetical protein DXB50_11015 [Butyricicoccus sp. OM04-18BH]